jgi:hypothetical protein
LTACASARGLFPNNNLLLYQGAINIVRLNELSAFPFHLILFIIDWPQRAASFSKSAWKIKQHLGRERFFTSFIYLFPFSRLKEVFLAARGRPRPRGCAYVLRSRNLPATSLELPVEKKEDQVCIIGVKKLPH